MALAHPVVQRLPITATIVYLLIGVGFGPWWQDVIRVDPILHAQWLHRAAEVSVIISLFTVGMKLRLPLRDPRLRPALCLASLSMVITVGLVTLAGVWLLHLPLGAAVLLGGMLAPTDPVLASDVQTKDPHDQDKLRLTLTAEGGMNDGTAFPFVMLGLGLLGLHDLGPHGWRWWLIDGVWAVAGGVLTGVAIGYAVCCLVLALNTRNRKPTALGEYVVLGLIGASYGTATLLNASGFMAVFAAGVALRSMDRTGPKPATDTELDAVDAHHRAPATAPAAEANVATPPDAAHSYFAGSLLATNEQLERILEVGLVMVVGAVLTVAGLSPEALWFAPLLFFVIRSLATLPLLLVARFTPFEFGAISWFGIRGIGSIFYLMFAIDRGLEPALADTLTSFTLTLVALSILMHGVSGTPLLTYYGRLTGRRT